MNSSTALPRAASPATLPLLRQRIDDRLAELLPVPRDAGDLVGAAMRDGVLATGKRTRPLLMLLIGKGLDRDSHALLDLACAVEMVHTASLFLDDMPCMDNSWLRRGQAAIHVRYGEDVAVLAAVALLSHSWCLVASAKGLPAQLRTELMVVLCDAIGTQGLVRGQYRDLREGAAQRGLDEIVSANQQKTGSLFSGALEMAARACGATVATREAVRAAAHELGHAFQMRDDLEDGAESLPGNAASKDRNKDVGKSTIVALLGRDEVKRRLQTHLLNAESQLAAAMPGGGHVVGMMLEAFGVPSQAPATVSAMRYPAFQSSALPA